MCTSELGASLDWEREDVGGMERRAAPPRTIYVVRGRPALNDRGPLPAGHVLSWGAITSGTVLEDAVYPFPVFD